ncbi:Hsp20/alpha crystallin family protein [Catelliglobosispora koreensis]|uniref:Hsp20/alpha crystallin family protein n=1 Tax=Catelliglobosispora koreensis TaxID=129052 RepID=UPI0003707B89|nr:Hsp20/alpha crystallin family protein [Catelliglobosispora koreensis]
MLQTTKRVPFGLHDLADLSWFPFLEPVIRIEERLEDGQYTVRAEIPGVDPEKDIAITTENGVLRLAVVRLSETESKEDGRSEFRYGTFHRSVTLPAGTKEETIKASYANGILEITMKVAERGQHERSVPIAVTNGQHKSIKKN